MRCVHEGPGAGPRGLGQRSTSASLGGFKAHSVSGVNDVRPDLNLVQQVIKQVHIGCRKLVVLGCSGEHPKFTSLERMKR